MLGATASADPRPRGHFDLAARIAVAPVPPWILPRRQRFHGTCIEVG
jgi:hypothetical protein